MSQIEFNLARPAYLIAQTARLHRTVSHYGANGRQQTNTTVHVGTTDSLFKVLKPPDCTGRCRIMVPTEDNKLIQLSTSVQQTLCSRAVSHYGANGRQQTNITVHVGTTDSLFKILKPPDCTGRCRIVVPTEDNKLIQLSTSILKPPDCTGRCRIVVLTEDNKLIQLSTSVQQILCSRYSNRQIAQGGTQTARLHRAVSHYGANGRQQTNTTVHVGTTDSLFKVLKPPDCTGRCRIMVPTEDNKLIQLSTSVQQTLCSRAVSHYGANGRQQTNITVHVGTTDSLFKILKPPDCTGRCRIVVLTEDNKLIQLSTSVQQILCSRYSNRQIAQGGTQTARLHRAVSHYGANGRQQTNTTVHVGTTDSLFKVLKPPDCTGRCRIMVPTEDNKLIQLSTSVQQTLCSRAVSHYGANGRQQTNITVHVGTTDSLFKILKPPDCTGRCRIVVLTEDNKLIQLSTSVQPILCSRYSNRQIAQGGVALWSKRKTTN
ncbi:hypothetical protein J6590_032702 [Homalodisca vitripennis]|nr:hypothetical protein J6590_032702 [Homalodisca vitripennis]